MYTCEALPPRLSLLATVDDFSLIFLMTKSKKKTGSLPGTDRSALQRFLYWGQTSEKAVLSPNMAPGRSDTLHSTSASVSNRARRALQGPPNQGEDPALPATWDACHRLLMAPVDWTVSRDGAKSFARQGAGPAERTDIARTLKYQLICP